MMVLKEQWFKVRNGHNIFPMISLQWCLAAADFHAVSCIESTYGLMLFVDSLVLFVCVLTIPISSSYWFQGIVHFICPILFCLSLFFFSLFFKKFHFLQYCIVFLSFFLSFSWIIGHSWVYPYFSMVTLSLSLKFIFLNCSVEVLVCIVMTSHTFNCCVIYLKLRLQFVLLNLSTILWFVFFSSHFLFFVLTSRKCVRYFVYVF